jgi:hypothetical protein
MANTIIKTFSVKNGLSVANTIIIDSDRKVANLSSLAVSNSVITLDNVEFGVFANGTLTIDGNTISSGPTGPQGPSGPSGPAGSGGGGESTQIYADLFSGTGACTEFTLSSNSTTNTVYVFLNGVSQVPNTDYTVSNNLLTFVTAPPANSNVDVRVFGNVSVVAGSSGGSGTTVTRDSYSGDGSNTTFTLSTTPASEEYTIVFVDGVIQKINNYNVDSTSLTFDSAPESNSEIDVITISGGGSNSSGSGITTGKAIAMSIVFGG